MSKTTHVIDLDENMKKVYVDDQFKKEEKIIQKERYENGQYMYNSFPEIIQDDMKNIIINSLKLNILKTKHTNEINKYKLEINSINVELDESTYLPTSFTNVKRKDEEKQIYKITINNVKNEDLN